MDGIREGVEALGVIGFLLFITIVAVYRTYIAFQNLQLKKADAKLELARREAEMKQQQQKADAELRQKQQMNDAEIRLIEAKTAAQVKIAEQQSEASQTTVIADLSRGLMGLFTESGTVLKEIVKTLQAMQLKVDATSEIASLAIAHYQAANLHHDNTAVHNSLVEPMMVNIYNKVASTEEIVTSIETKVDEMIRLAPAPSLVTVLTELTAHLKHYLENNKSVSESSDPEALEREEIGRLVDETTGATREPLKLPTTPPTEPDPPTTPAAALPPEQAEEEAEEEDKAA